MDTELYEVDFLLQDGELVKEVTLHSGIRAKEPATYAQKRAYFLGLMRGAHLGQDRVAEEINKEVKDDQRDG